ncbi:hypothetical protein DRN52_08550 [Thermococci archaeon]|nr:MAG: hypothetical protein DRN52_08550 [Thermococci archaeon]
MIYELVVKKGSKDSEEAENILRECLMEGVLGEDGVFKVVVLRDEVDTLPYGVGKGKTPTLRVIMYGRESLYQGLDEIRKFIHKLRAKRRCPYRRTTK